MKRITYSFGAIVLSLSMLTSCSSDNDDATNPVTYEIPSTYSFDRNGVTTVEFDGQTTRLNMLNEMGAKFTDAGTNGTALNVLELQNMFSNTNNAFSSAALNSSGKNIKSKTAASNDYFTLFLGGGSTAEKVAVQSYFESQFTIGNVASLGNSASAGVAGSYLDGSKMRLFAANGLEPQQILLKGMMGALMMDQISNQYLSVNTLDKASTRIENTNKVLAENSNFTTMEHYWDEAYGYVYGADDVATNSLKFWSSYIKQVNEDADFNTVSTDINLAFRKGRAAIVNNDYLVRDQQTAIIQKNLALVAAVRSVYYLQEGKAKLVQDNGAKAFHALSEGYGFIMSLRYTRQPGTDNPYFSKVEVDAMLASLVSGPNGLWDIDNLSPKLDAISAQIASRFGFSVEQAATVN
ncbi:DUF4856 domain-containing protein [Flavobacterium antarcticum]|uniref:DUF4856 domain-containing protein n=1 Tax=Flavobacterium antarcticum TaxID=271155 RepID=UPI0003B595A6|nr:DUF4856 domain-containing protein [Flavobacterium antarcticum]